MNILRPVTRCGPEGDKKGTRISQRPLRICVVFDEEASFRSAEILIRHLASDQHCETQTFGFDELEAPVHGIAAARNAAGTEILVVAIRGNRIPAHMQFWLGLCLSLRDDDQEGALVALISYATETRVRHGSLIEYLETVAAIGGLAFLPWWQSPHTWLRPIPHQLPQLRLTE